MTKRVAMIGASNDRAQVRQQGAARLSRTRDTTSMPSIPGDARSKASGRYASILDVPGAVDIATFYVPPDIGLQVIDEVAQKGVHEVWLNPGSESPALVARAQAASGSSRSSRAASSRSANGPAGTESASRPRVDTPQIRLLYSGRSFLSLAAVAAALARAITSVASEHRKYGHIRTYGLPSTRPLHVTREAPTATAAAGQRHRDAEAAESGGAGSPGQGRGLNIERTEGDGHPAASPRSPRT